MNLKVFLKPDWRKIVLFVILSVVLSVYVFLWITTHTAVCLAIGCPTIEEVALGGLVTALPFILVFSYILSCLIIFAYDKLRGAEK